MFNNVTGQYEHNILNQDDHRRHEDSSIGSNLYFNPNNVLDPLTQRGIELASAPGQFIEHTQQTITSKRANKIFFALIIALMIAGNFLIPGHS